MKKKNIQKLLVFMLIATLIMSLTACSGTKPEQSKEKELQKMSIVLDWYPNAIHCFLYNAIEKGYFAAEGIELEILFPANPNDGIAMPAAGKADFGIYYMHDIIKARADENVPVKSIATLVQEPLNVILSLKEKNINRPKDLEGKKVGYAGMELSEVKVKEMVKNDGGDPSKVEFINVGWELMSALTTKQVDATTDNVENHELPFIEKQGFELNTLYEDEYGIPNYYGMSIVAGEKTLKDKQALVDAFLRAIDKGYADMKNDKAGSLDILFKYQNEENFPLDREVEEKSLDILLEKMELAGKPFLSQEAKAWQESAEWMKKLGFVNNDIAGEEFIYTPQK